MPTRRKRILVTGGAGFVGSHLVEALLARDVDILVIDNFFAGRRDNVPPGTGLVEMDLGRAEEGEVFSVCRDFAPDAVVHLAAIHHIPYCLANPGHTFESNVRSTEVLVRAMGRFFTGKIVVASTADVYANTDIAHAETDSLEPANPYGLSKLLTEEIAACGVRISSEMSAVVLRLFNIYGPRETNSHVIPRIIELIKSPAEAQIRMGYLGGTRDFVHVADVVVAILKALDYIGPRFEVFNIGAGAPVSIRTVLNTLMEAAGDHREVIEDLTKFRQFERKSLTADISKAKTRLKWNPSRRIEANLAPLLDEYNPAAIAHR